MPVGFAISLSLIITAMKILLFAFVTFISLLLPAETRAAVSVVDIATKSETDDDGIIGNLNMTITGGNILLFSLGYDAGVDGILDGTVSATFGGSALTPVITSFRADGEVGSAIFAMISPVPSTGGIEVIWGINSGTSFVAASSLSAITLSGVDTSNPFGSQASNLNLSTGITLNNIEAGNLSLYAIGAQQGLGAPPLDLNGANAVGQTGFVTLDNAGADGARVLSGAFIQQTTGSVEWSHFQTIRESAASAIEINAVPEPSTIVLLSLACAAFFVRRRRSSSRG